MMNTALIPIDQPTSQKIMSDLQDCLSRLWGDDLRVCTYEPLSERISCVARVHLEGSHAQAPTIIVKHMPLNLYPAQRPENIPQELYEEAVCYQFFQQETRFTLAAQLYAFDERGFMLLQDLGTEGIGEEESLEVLSARLAHTFSSLHLATFNKGDRYQKLRDKAGLPKPLNDPRAYSLSAHRRRFRLGAATIKDYSNIMGLSIPASFSQYIDLIEAEIENPGIFLCFVHDDMANARQVIKRNHQFYLIDFENAKYSHALLDLCKPLAGKFEMLLEDGDFFYANPNFPVGFIDDYRLELFNLGEKTFKQTQWDSAFTHALLYHCLALVGKLIEISSQRKLRKDFAFDLCTILSRHLLLLSHFDTFTPLRSLLDDLLAKIYRPEFNQT